MDGELEGPLSAPAAPTEPTVMFVKPGAISDDDKAALRAVGIIVVTIDRPEDAKLVRPRRLPAEMPHGDLLAAAAMAMEGNSYAQQAFGRNAAAAIIKRHKPRA